MRRDGATGSSRALFLMDSVRTHAFKQCSDILIDHDGENPPCRWNQVVYEAALSVSCFCMTYYDFGPWPWLLATGNIGFTTEVMILAICSAGLRSFA